MTTAALVVGFAALIVGMLTLRRVIDTEDRLERDLDALEAAIGRLSDGVRELKRTTK